LHFAGTLLSLARHAWLWQIPCGSQAAGVSVQRGRCGIVTLLCGAEQIAKAGSEPLPFSSTTGLRRQGFVNWPRTQNLT
jgi:hypothetical protein